MTTLYQRATFRRVTPSNDDEGHPSDFVVAPGDAHIDGDRALATISGLISISSMRRAVIEIEAPERQRRRFQRLAIGGGRPR